MARTMTVDVGDELMKVLDGINHSGLGKVVSVVSAPSGRS